MTRLFHISDLHFGAEDRNALQWFKALAEAEAPDAVVVTGDLTMRARHSEFEAAGTWLKSLGRPVTVEVGNHDIPYFNPIDRFLRPYRRYEAVERVIERPLGLRGVVIVPLRTTARFQWRLNWSKGTVSQASLDGALALAAGVPRDALVFVACHHPLAEADTRARARTRRGNAALAALAAAGVKAVLSGHVHDPFDVAHATAHGEIRLIGAGTLSQRVRATRPSFNEIRVAGGRFETLVRVMDAA